MSKAFAFICLASSFLFVLWGIRDFTYGGGDDVFLITPEFIAPYLNSLKSLAFLDLLQNRRFLHLLYYSIYHSLGDSVAWAARILSLFLFLASWTLFLTLRRLIADRLALVSALFFLVYAGKFEIMGIYQGTAYHLVLFFAALMLYTLVKLPHKPLLRFGLCATFLWMSLLVYEVLIVLAPFFILASLLEQRSSEKVFRTPIWASCLPLVMALIHLMFIATSPNPIWNRISGEETSLGSRLAKIPRVFRWGLEAIAGPDYFSVLRTSVLSFFRDTGFQDPMLLIWGILSGLFLALFFKSSPVSQAPTKPHPLKKLWFFLLLAGAVFSPMVALTVADGFVSSRFTYVPSLFLSLLLGASLHHLQFSRPVLYRYSLGAALIFISINALSLSSISYQFARAGELDRKIHRELSRLLPRLEEGTHIVSLIPMDPLDPYWTPHRVIGARYHVSPTASFLWGLNPHLRSDVGHKGIVKREQWKEHLHTHLVNLRPQARPLYCFDFNTQWEAAVVTEFNFQESQEGKRETFKCDPLAKAPSNF